MGIALLILGLVHTPLPQPDFHNIRHHDGAGEVCEHHDHLLRWHPGAGRADDVAVLHWHWFLPTADPFDLTPEGTGPAIHAHVADWQATTWDDGPRLSAVPTVRSVTTPTAAPAFERQVLAQPATPVSSVPWNTRVHSFSATFAPSAPLACLFQRWDC
jgi:hypothetical protein